MAKTELEKEFHNAMQSIYDRCAKEIGTYKPTKFLKMLHTDGATATARTLIMRSTPSEGYYRLCKEKRLDLTVEAILVDNEQFHTTELFSDIEEVLKKAKMRLRQYEYNFKE